MAVVLKQAVCVIVPRVADSDDPDVLVVSRRSSPNLWGLPGGKVDFGETASKAAARELLEETGVRVYEEELVPIFSTICPGETPYWVTTYLCVAYLPLIEKILVPEEGLRVDWASFADLTDPKICPFWNYNEGVVEAFIDYRHQLALYNSTPTKEPV